MTPTTAPKVAFITGVTGHDGADLSKWLPPVQADSVRRILWAHLPCGARVSVFGSRATGRGFKPHSDLDLLIDSPVELPLIILAELREALTESDLTFAVDLLDRRDASAEFLSRLEHSGMVELRILPAELVGSPCT